MLKAVVAHSEDPDSSFAIAAVLQDCLRQLAGQRPQAGILLAAIDFDHGLILQRIHDCFPGIELIGGTTDGEISSVLGFQQDSLVLMVFAATEDIEIRAGIGQGVGADAAIATHQAVTQALAKSQLAPQLCLTFPESLTGSSVAILQGLKQALGPVPIFGGLTADQWRFKQTYQFYQTGVYQDAVPVLLFGGNVVFAHGVASGWHPLGNSSRVTRVDGNVLYAVEGQSALAFYHHYLGPLAPSSEYPLAVFEPDATQCYMRAPSGSNPADGSITFFADIPAGAIVQITTTSHDDILAASKASMEMALANYPGVQPAAALLFSCASRRQILGTRTQEEYRTAQHCFTACFPVALPICGFYANGEIAPVDQVGASHFHNETFVTLLLGSK